jgi:hypothetical protein
MTKPTPEILEVKSQQVEAMLARAAQTMSPEDADLMHRIVVSYDYITDLVEDKNTTIARLRKLFFGSKSEKSKDVLETDQQDHSGQQHDAEEEDPEDDPNQGGGENQRVSPPGHGRRRAEDYRGAEQIEVKHPTLAPGDRCPECQGSLYEKAPGVLVRFVGQAPLGATVYHLQKLRCQTCGITFTAPQPANTPSDKYDHTAASMIGLLKYGSGLPFNRIQRLQGNCEIPLAASTQWAIVNGGASLMLPVYQELIRQAAQGEVLYNDDTTIKILELMGANRKQALSQTEDPNRSGMFTSGVVSTRDGVRIALFFSGRKHAGENLADVLQQRADELQAPIQMCDGLSRNLPKELETILASCIAHGRRKFVDLIDRFPEQCAYVIETFKVVYRTDMQARQQNMNAQQRLDYHQTHSGPVMDELNAWLKRQLTDKLVEANSALGEAITYLLKRWDALTLFLRQAGAPLDNNICERALKKCILHRKNSLFFRTCNGAMVGDVYMSLIYTCELNRVSAFDYLNQLQLHSAEVAEHPERWQPWNYQKQLATPAAA